MVESSFKSRYWSALSQFLYTSTVLLGLAFLAWGLDTLPTFFSNPARAAFSLVVLLQALTNAGMAYVSPPEPEHEHRFDLASGILLCSKPSLCWLHSKTVATF
jgi:hypothetical protein